MSVASAPILEVRNVSKRFNGAKTVDEVSFSLSGGTITALIGPNGAGKTTLFNLINGYMHPDFGRIVFNGKDIAGVPVYKIAGSGLGRLFQDVRTFPKLSVFENVLIGCDAQTRTSLPVLLGSGARVSAAQKHKIKSALEWAGLSHKSEALAEELSFGQQKLLAMARLSCTDAHLLLLDEPFAGVADEVVRKQIVHLLKTAAKSGTTVLLIEHLLSVVWEISDHIIIMDEGKIVNTGTAEQVIKSPVLGEVFLGN